MGVAFTMMSMPTTAGFAVTLFGGDIFRFVHDFWMVGAFLVAKMRRALRYGHQGKCWCGQFPCR